MVIVRRRRRRGRVYDLEKRRSTAFYRQKDDNSFGTAVNKYVSLKMDRKEKPIITISIVVLEFRKKCENSCLFRDTCTFLFLYFC